MSIVKKCPVCNSDSILQDSKPIPAEGKYSKIYKCEKGHIYKVIISYKGIKKTTVQIIKGEGDEEH